MSTWIDVCAVEDIAPLGTRVLKAGDTSIALFRTSGNEVYALEDKCPHKGGPLSQGIVHGRRVTCPLHNWVIELRGGEAVAPDAGCVRTFEIELREGRVFIQMLARASNKSKAAV